MKFLAAEERGPGYFRDHFSDSVKNLLCVYVGLLQSGLCLFNGCYNEDFVIPGFLISGFCYCNFRQVLFVIPRISFYRGSTANKFHKIMSVKLNHALLLSRVFD